MRQYAIIANLERNGTKHYTLSSLPLHVTVLSIFFSEREAEFFVKIIGSVASGFGAIKTHTTQRALFGVDEDIPVTLVEKTDELERLHLRLLKKVTDTVTFRAPQFTGRNFGPHVTDQSGTSVDVGKQLIIDNLSLVEIKDQEVTILCVEELR